MAQVPPPNRGDPLAAAVQAITDPRNFTSSFGGEGFHPVNPDLVLESLSHLGMIDRELRRLCRDAIRSIAEKSRRSVGGLPFPRALLRPTARIPDRLLEPCWCSNKSSKAKWKSLGRIPRSGRLSLMAKYPASLGGSRASTASPSAPNPEPDH